MAIGLAIIKWIAVILIIMGFIKIIECVCEYCLKKWIEEELFDLQVQQMKDSYKRYEERSEIARIKKDLSTSNECYANRYKETINDIYQIKSTIDVFNDNFEKLDINMKTINSKLANKKKEEK